MKLPQVAVIELGSQYTLLIERSLRELGVISIILSPDQALSHLQKNPPKAIILSGGKSSVHDKDAPRIPDEILSLRQKNGKPVAILGICYGMQWLAHTLGGEVRSGHAEYAAASITLCEKPEGLFADTSMKQDVWMSHGDAVIVFPRGFKALAYSYPKHLAAMQNGLIWGVQFHPEVKNTKYGQAILQNFLGQAGCEKDWWPTSIVRSIQNKVVEEIGDRKAIIGLSGGVDSLTLTAILSPVLKDQLIPVIIDGGQFREGELEEVLEHAKVIGVKPVIIKAKRRFAKALAKIVDAEKKRKRFREIYQSLLRREAERLGASVVIQGTLGPDRIESGATGGARIKSHHNVGLDMGKKIVQLHPVGNLFKYEIRALARELGLPESIWNRQPFPGPGLFVRVVGVPATPDKLAIVRWADARVREILIKHKINDEISQLVVSYLGVNTVGVKGDARVYGGSIVIRAVETLDFMTAEGVWFQKEIVNEIKSTLTTHPKIIRALFDPTDKPPATTEME